MIKQIAGKQSMFASTATLVLVIFLRCDLIVDSIYINRSIVTLPLHSDFSRSILCL
jgi:hypothetical protein